MNSGINGNAGAHKRIRIVIADDSAEFRGALGLLLDRQPQVEVVGEAMDGVDALALVARERPDLVLMDLQMPQVNGLHATRKIRAEFPDVRVIVITVHDSEKWKAVSDAAGADRFISKHHLRDELPGAIAQLFPGRAGGTEDKRP